MLSADGYGMKQGDLDFLTYPMNREFLFLLAAPSRKFDFESFL